MDATITATDTDTNGHDEERRESIFTAEEEKIVDSLMRRFKRAWDYLGQAEWSK